MKGNTSLKSRQPAAMVLSGEQGQKEVGIVQQRLDAARREVVSACSSYFTGEITKEQAINRIESVYFDIWKWGSNASTVLKCGQRVFDQIARTESDLRNALGFTKRGER